MEAKTTKKIEPTVIGHGIRRDGTAVLLHAEGKGIRMWFLKRIASRNLKKWNFERRHLVDGCSSH